jgi:hypothetical protein
MPIVTGYAQCAEGLMREFDRGYSEVTFRGSPPDRRARGDHPQGIPPVVRRPEAGGRRGKVRKLGHTNYDVADQLSNLGMEAIHPKAAKTLRQAGVPLRVTNAFEPQDPGTLIDDQPTPHDRRPRVEIVTGLGVVRAGSVRAGHGGREGLRRGDPRRADAAQRADRVEILERQHDHALRRCAAQIRAPGRERRERGMYGRFMRGSNRGL